MLDFIKIFILVSIGCCMAQVYANADQFDIIQIKPDKISINSSSKIDRKVISKDEVILTLKNTKPSDDVKLIYDTQEPENIVVRQDKRNTKVIIKAPNAINLKIDGNVSQPNGYSQMWTICAGLLTLLMLLGRKPKKRALNTKKRIRKISFIRRNRAKKKAEKIEIAA